MYVCDKDINFASFSTISLSDFGTMWYFFAFPFIYNIEQLIIVPFIIIINNHTT